MSHPAPSDYAGAKLGMWLFLFSELLLFSGLFLLYAIYLSDYPHHFALAGGQLDAVLGTVNTLVLLTSSLLAAMAVTAIQHGDRQSATQLLWGTVSCAAVFLIIKYLEWHEKIVHGIYPGSTRLASGPPGESVFFSLYFMTTGIHGLHVMIGASLLIWVAFRISRTVHADDDILLENSALYWHLVDLIWIYIFPMYYLIL